MEAEMPPQELFQMEGPEFCRQKSSQKRSGQALEKYAAAAGIKVGEKEDTVHFQSPVP